MRFKSAFKGLIQILLQHLYRELISINSVLAAVISSDHLLNRSLETSSIITHPPDLPSAPLCVYQKENKKWTVYWNIEQIFVMPIEHEKLIKDYGIPAKNLGGGEWLNTIKHISGQL
jgi:hypothetical protein